MDDELGSLNVAEKFMAEAHALRGALDESRDICDDKALGTGHVHHTQIRAQGRKVIVGDLRPCVGDSGQEGGFPYVGEAHKPHVRDHLQLQVHPQLLCRLPGLGVLGNLHGGCGKVLVAKAALSALQDDLPAVVAGHVRNDLAGLGLFDHRALGHLQYDVVRVGAVASPLAPRLSVLCRVFSPVTEILERVQAFVHLKDHVAAPSAVAAVGAAVGHIELPPEAYMAVAALAGADEYFCSVCKHVVNLLMKKEPCRLQYTAGSYLR